MLSRFGLSTCTRAERDKIVDRVMDFGRPAVVQLVGAVRRQAESQLPKYEILFHDQAQRIAYARAEKADVNEIERLRAQVLSLRLRNDLTKQMIQEEGDPALKELRELLATDGETVVEESAKVRAARESLFALEGYAALCLLDYPDLVPEPPPGEKIVPLQKRIARIETLSAASAVPTHAKNRAVLAANAQLFAKLDREEAAVIRECNRMRILLGLDAVAVDLRLCAAARDHSSDMERLKFFSHGSPVPGKTEFGDRARNFGTSARAENIYSGTTSGRTANAGWWRSPGHHKNMLASHGRIGVGRSGHYFTEMFGR